MVGNDDILWPMDYRPSIQLQLIRIIYEMFPPIKAHADTRNINQLLGRFWGAYLWDENDPWYRIG